MKDLVRRVQDAAQTAGARRVNRVHVRLGVLSQMSPDHFRDHFAMATAGTLAAEAELEIEMAEAADTADAQSVRLVDIDIEA
jgi:hydrogenase nickel incorporation protein HypA/HybF